MSRDWSAWGHLADRYRDTNRPRRMLALDGGGILGIITVEVLVELERKLGEHYNDSALKLCEFFDYIGGTSTGAIIAAGLSRGMSAKAVQEFYLEFGKEAFAKRNVLMRWKSLYRKGELESKLKEVFGPDATLEPEYLETLLLVVTRNQTTDSAWPISSNPSAKYNERTRADCNLRIPLWQLVRASTAAPVYFSPEVVDWDPADPTKSFVFVDGGTTPYNCPAFLMYRMATDPAYRLEWVSGEDNLLVVSVGTGSAPVLGDTADASGTNLAEAGVNTLKALMTQAMFDQDLNCRTIGRCVHGRSLDREVMDLIPRDDKGNPLPLSTNLRRSFLYARYDPDVTKEGLDKMGLNHIKAEHVSKLDATEYMDDLSEVGRAVAREVDLTDLGGFLELPVYKSRK